MSSREVPERWARRIMESGYRRQRGAGPNISMFAEAIGAHTSTVMNALIGTERTPDPSTVRKIVEALGRDTAAWFGLEQVKPWEPPASSAYLTDRQRKALTDLIDSMTERAGEGDGQQPAAKTRAGDAGAEVTQFPRQSSDATIPPDLLDRAADDLGKVETEEDAIRGLKGDGDGG